MVKETRGGRGTTTLETAEHFPGGEKDGQITSRCQREQPGQETYESQAAHERDQLVTKVKEWPRRILS